MERRTINRREVKRLFSLDRRSSIRRELPRTQSKLTNIYNVTFGLLREETIRRR